MLSLPAFHLNDTSSDGHNEGIQDGIVLGYNTENWIFEFVIDYDEGWVFDLGFHFNFDIPTFELEFEPLKASADQSSGREDTYSDANIVASFRHQLKTISQSGLDSTKLQRMFYNIYPAQANQVTDNEVTYNYLNTSLTIIDEITMSEDILGVPQAAYGSMTTDESFGYEFEGWWNHWNDKHLGHFSRYLNLMSDIRVQSDISLTEDNSVEDYRHTFHTTEQLKDQEQWTNTWRNWYKLGERTDWLSQNIFTGLVLPEFMTDATWDGQAEQLKTALNTSFSGMSLKRSWYQKEVFNENFFVNAKGKYIQMPNTDLGGYPQIMYGENLDITFLSSINDTGDDMEARETPDHVLFQLMDYLTKDRLRKYSEGRKQYELVVTGYSEAPYFDEMIFFDFDVTDFRAGDITFGGSLAYDFMFNSKIYRQSSETTWWDFSNSEQWIQGIKIRYARRNLNSSGRITSWTFLDEEEGAGSPFTILSDEGESVNQKLIEFEDTYAPQSNVTEELNSNNRVFIYLNDENLIGGLENSVHAIPIIYTNAQDVKQLISKPSDVVQDVVSRELGLPTNISKKNIFDTNYKLDFSIDKIEKGIDVMQKIAECSPFFYKNEIASGIPSIVGINHLYDNASVDKKINVNNIFKYKFKNTKKEDVALKCRVKYGYDYVSEKYTKVTPDVENLNPDDYINYYDIKDEEAHILEHEAQYIQDQVSAEMLAKHLFEINKNQHLNISFQVPLSEALALEVGDTISFIDNNGNRADIGGVKPFGKTTRNITFLNGQAVFPYFMITSISKDLTKSDIVVTQLHELAPSDYDDWSVVDWEDYVVDDITGDMIIPPVDNEPPTINIITGSGMTPTTNLDSIIVLWSAQDGDGQLLGYQIQVQNEDASGEIVSSYSDNTHILDTPTQSIGLRTEVISNLISDYGSYYISIKVYDDNGASTTDAYVGQFIEYTPENPIATISYVSGDLNQMFNAGQVIVTSEEDLQDEFDLPYSEESYELTLSAGGSLSEVPNTDLTYAWVVETDEGETEYNTEEITIQTQGGEDYLNIALEVTNIDGLTQNTDVYFVVLEDEESGEEETPVADRINIDFDLVNGWIVNDDEFKTIEIYMDMINNGQPYANNSMRIIMDYVEDDVDFKEFFVIQRFIDSNHPNGEWMHEILYAGEDVGTNWWWSLWLPDFFENYSYSEPVPNAGGTPFCLEIYYKDNAQSFTKCREIHFYLDEWNPSGDSDGNKD